MMVLKHPRFLSKFVFHGTKINVLLGTWTQLIGKRRRICSIVFTSSLRRETYKHINIYIRSRRKQMSEYVMLWKNVGMRSNIYLYLSPLWYLHPSCPLIWEYPSFWGDLHLSRHPSNPWTFSSCFVCSLISGNSSSTLQSYVLLWTSFPWIQLEKYQLALEYLKYIWEGQ